MILVASEYSRHPKIGDLRVPILIQKYIARFKVSVDYSEPRVSVKVEKASTNPLDDIETLPPV